MAFSLIANTTATGSGTNTPAINTTGSNLIVIGVSYVQAGAPTIADNQSNTWALMASALAFSATSTIALYYAYAPTTSASHTFSCTATDAAIFVEAFTGSTSSPLDQHNSGTGSSPTIQPGSVTPTQKNELLVSVAANNTGGGNTLNSVDSGFTITDKATGGSSTLASGLAYLIQTTATAENPTFTFQVSSAVGAIIATFKSPTGFPYGFTMPFPT